eukprot:g4940.t1
MIEDEELNNVRHADGDKSEEAYKPNTKIPAANTKGCAAGTTSREHCRLISNELYYSVSHGKDPKRQCSWCQKAAKKKCLSCEDITAEVDDGWYCNPGKAECENGKVGSQRTPAQSGGYYPHLLSNGYAHVGIKRIPWTTKMFCRMLEPRLTTFNAADFKPVDVAWHFVVYCRSVLGTVCTAQCELLSQLYDQLGRTSNPDQFDENIGMIMPGKHPVATSPYKLTHVDCYRCLEMDNCVPECLLNGDCDTWNDFAQT